MITAACFEHHHIIGTSVARLSQFETTLLDTVRPHSKELIAWVVLPNHYHVITATDSILQLLRALGRCHGRTSWQWNGEDNTRGRHVWYRCVETAIKSERHLWAATNYIHHNPVKHGWVDTWDQWPYSSLHHWVESRGAEEMTEMWRRYPVLDFGRDWDR